MTTHRNTADYFAGIPQYAGRISPANLNAALAAAWDKGYGTGWVDGAQNAHGGKVLPVVNPYSEVS